jgi:hypothetical protein
MICGNKHQKCSGFTSLLATEFVVFAAIYALYFGMAFRVMPKLMSVTGWPIWLLVLIPIMSCFLLSAAWYALRRILGHPKGSLSLFGNTHLLVLACSILLPIAFWLFNWP